MQMSEFKKLSIAGVALAIIILLFVIFYNSGQQNNQENKLQNNNQNTNMSDSNQIVTLKTSAGDIKIELLADKAPNTVDNFVKLASDGFYDGTRFHRVIKDFMIQGGDPLSRDEGNREMWGTGGPGYTFDDEPNDVALVQGVLAMANAGPNTNGSQFFIITAEATPWLQGAHTGFGRVVEGLDVVLEIGNTETGPGDQPVEDVVLESVVLE
jgi:cyclophilin family peptidyl-prolyl cis-trans isomerase